MVLIFVDVLSLKKMQSATWRKQLAYIVTKSFYFLEYILTPNIILWKNMLLANKHHITKQLKFTHSYLKICVKQHFPAPNNSIFTFLPHPRANIIVSNSTTGTVTVWSLREIGECNSTPTRRASLDREREDGGCPVTAPAAILTSKHWNRYGNSA